MHPGTHQTATPSPLIILPTPYIVRLYRLMNGMLHVIWTNLLKADCCCYRLMSWVRIRKGRLVFIMQQKAHPKLLMTAFNWS